VRRDALLGDAVHLLRADLHLHAVGARPDDRRVQRLVKVGLGSAMKSLKRPGTGVQLECTTPSTA